MVATIMITVGTIGTIGMNGMDKETILVGQIGGTIQAGITITGITITTTIIGIDMGTDIIVSS